MADLSHDPIVNVIHNGIKGGIRLLVDNDHLRGALLLTLSGMDTMAFLGMPAEQQNVGRSDFVEWTDRYIEMPCEEQITGLELYGARCAALHAYGTESTLSRDGRCRQLIWMGKARPEVSYNKEKHPVIALVSIPALVESFFSGIDRYMVDLFADPARGELANNRFKKIMHDLPVPPEDG